MDDRFPLNRRIFVAAGMAISLLSWVPAQSQESRWATADDSTAKSLLDFERQWAESACTQNDIKKTILAEHFQGTAPDGTRYSKREAVAHSLSGKPEQACTLHEVTVHFFGDVMAILYGSESAVHIETDGRRHTVKLTWTDTWLKRHGIWQIVAAQDMPTETK
jgi:Domain of unknown function (DUF4440)